MGTICLKGGITAVAKECLKKKKAKRGKKRFHIKADL